MNFNFGPQDVYLLSKNPDEAMTSVGYLNLYRFIIFDSASPAMNFFNKYSLPPL